MNYFYRTFIVVILVCVKWEAKIEFLSTYKNFIFFLDISGLLHVSAYIKAIIR